MNAKAGLRSMRLRTLPLSLAGTVMGVCIAATVVPQLSRGTWLIFLTTALLQVLSNLSNELGDTLHGTDTADRQGIRYSLQDEEMTIKEMKYLIAATAFLCCISGLAMVWLAFGTLLAAEPLLLLLLGAAAIWAAMHYTLGKNPYGYRGLGDVFVFIFFGLVSCCGACYVSAHTAGLAEVLKASALPACTIGLFSVGVLNVNNIRDAATDAATRTTTAILLGGRRARIYHTVLLTLGWCLMLCFSIVNTAGAGPLRWLYVLTLPLYILHLKGVWTREGRALDPMLPLLVLSTFGFSLLGGLGLLLNLFQ